VSLRGALEEAARQFEAEHAELKVDLQFAGSQQLRLQVEQGARADLFMSADERNVQTLTGEGLVEGEPVTVARNRLALVVPADNPGRLGSWRDLARPGVRFDRAAPVVPLGGYTDEALRRMAGEAGPGFVAAVHDNTISEEDSAERVLAQVRLGEVDAAVVYASDAQEAGDKVAVLSFPDEFNPAVTYLAAVLKDADGDAARSFLSFLLSERGQRVLADHGLQRAE